MSDEARMWTELGRLGEDPLRGERSDADIVAAALAGVAGAPAAPVEAPAPRARAGSRVGIAVGLVLAVAAAVLLGWWLLPMTGLVGGRSEGSGSMAPALADDEPASGHAVERDHDGQVAAGRAPREGAPPGDPAEAREPTPEAATASGSDAAIEAAAPAEHGAAGESGTAGEPPAASASRALAGAPGDARGPGPAAPPRPTAPALLEHAQRLVSKGERAAAIAAYERLIERFPESREAKASQVSLGRLELDRGRAQEALARFDAYLAGSAGALVEEARYGRIRSLRQLGRLEQELRSIDAFLADHPESLYAARLRKRAEELRTP